MKAITTRYLPPTNYRGARIAATAEGGRNHPLRIVISDPDLDRPEDSHAEAALALCAKMNWSGRLIGGGLPDGRGFAFVFEPYRSVSVVEVLQLAKATIERLSEDNAAKRASVDGTLGVIRKALAETPLPVGMERMTAADGREAVRRILSGVSL